ncbi:MAG: hypothetical protein ACE5DX_03835 [Candidatus Dojkabacteria bacterium]
MTPEDKKLLIQRYFDDYNEIKGASLERRDRLVGEQTYKLCELIIVADTGILGAIGFTIIISQQIQPLVAVILAGTLLFIIYTIYRAFSLRDTILELSRSVADKKAKTADEIRQRITTEFEQLVNSSDEDFISSIDSIKREEKEDMKPTAGEINIQVTSILKGVNILRAVFIVNLIFVAVGIIIQLLGPGLN